MNFLAGIIGRIAQYALGIDQTEAEINNARQRFAKENLVHTLRMLVREFSVMLLLQEFEVADAFDVPRILQLQRRSGRRFNKIFIDLNGSREIGIVYACVEKLQRALRPELIVVKNIKMKALVLQCTPFEMESESSRDLGELPAADGQLLDASAASSSQYMPLSRASLGM